MAISSVTKGNVITTAKINEIITAANGAGVSLSVSGTTLYLKNGAGTNLSDVSVVAAALPAGTVVAFAANKAPTGGFLLCNGSAVSRTTYANLFSAISTLYGTGDGSTTFALPNLASKFIMGHGTAGTAYAAGLPNITGTFHLGSTGSQNCEGDGAFAINTAKTYSGDDNNGKKSGYQTTFAAKSSNSIYGASTTVQPPALTMRYYIKY